MAAKKRRKQTGKSQINPLMMAAITKELPGILAKEGYFSKPESATPNTTIYEPEPRQGTVTQLSHRPIQMNANPRMLWYTVIFFSLLIFGIWIFNVRVLMADVWNARTSQTLIDNSKNDLNAIFETIKQNDTLFQPGLAGTTSTATTTGTASDTNTSTVRDALTEALKKFNKNPR